MIFDIQTDSKYGYRSLKYQVFDKLECVDQGKVVDNQNMVRCMALVRGHSSAAATVIIEISVWGCSEMDSRIIGYCISAITVVLPINGPISTGEDDDN